VLRVVWPPQEVVGSRVAVVHVPDRAGQILTEEIDNSLLLSMGWKPQFESFLCVLSLSALLCSALLCSLCVLRLIDCAVLQRWTEAFVRRNV
jgi:hypothetical protein